MGTSELKKKAYFVISNKGGVGKTTVAKLIAQKMRAMPGVKSILVDGDVGVQGVSSVYGLTDGAGNYSLALNKAKPFGGVLQVDARGNAEAVSNQLNYKADLYLNDFPGGLTDPAPIFGDAKSLIDEFNREGIEVVVVIVVSHDRASSAGVLKAMNEWGQGARFVVVKNLGHAAKENFHFLEGSFAKMLGYPAKTAIEMGAVVTEMPGLDDVSLQTMEVLGLPFDKALEHLEGLRDRVGEEGDQEAGIDADMFEVFRPRIRKIQKFLADSEPMFQALGISGK
jgi:hypothetical protein